MTQPARLVVLPELVDAVLVETLVDNGANTSRRSIGNVSGSALVSHFVLSMICDNKVSRVPLKVPWYLKFVPVSKLSARFSVARPLGTTAEPELYALPVLSQPTLVQAKTKCGPPWPQS